MRCKYHVSVDMQVIERVPPHRHKSPSQVHEDEEFANRRMAKCPVERCPWVVEVYPERQT